MSKRFFHLFESPLDVTAWVILAAPGIALAGERPYVGDLGQAIATLIIFLVLLFILGKFAWRPIINQLRRREEDIAQQIDDAKISQKKADELAREYRDSLDNIEDESEQMLTLSRREANMESDRILDTAHEEARDVLKRANEDIEIARKQARKKLQVETASLAAEIAKRLLRKNLAPEDHHRLVAEATEQISKKAGEA